jgi:hypothetical protein
MGARKQFKKTHGGFPPTIYVKREENGEFKYFLCGERPEQLPFEVGETAEIGSYSFTGHMKAEAVIKLGDDKP